MYNNAIRELFDGIYQTIKASRLYRAMIKGRAISYVCHKKEDGTLTNNEEKRVHLILRTQFSESYSTAEDNNTLPDTPNRRDEKKNWKLAKEIC